MRALNPAVPGGASSGWFRAAWDRRLGLGYRLAAQGSWAFEGRRHRPDCGGSRPVARCRPGSSPWWRPRAPAPTAAPATILRAAGDLPARHRSRTERTAAFWATARDPRRGFRPLGAPRPGGPGLPRRRPATTTLWFLLVGMLVLTVVMRRSPSWECCSSCARPRGVVLRDERRRGDGRHHHRAPAGGRRDRRVVAPSRPADGRRQVGYHLSAAFVAACRGAVPRGGGGAQEPALWGDRGLSVLAALALAAPGSARRPALVMTGCAPRSRARGVARTEPVRGHGPR
jgi:hypothetical protein